MKKVFAACIALGLLDFLPILRADSAVVPNSQSPNGLYAARIDQQDGNPDLDFLSVYLQQTGRIVSRVLLGGYARFPANADPENLTILWSPDSTKFALMHRGSKRSWGVSVYSLKETEWRRVELPSASEKAITMIPSAKGYRVIREEPKRWLTNDQLVVRASGGAEKEREFLWYEVDITYAIDGSSIINATLVDTRPYNG